MLKRYAFYCSLTALLFLYNCGDDNSVEDLIAEISAVDLTTSIDENPANGATIGSIDASISDGSTLTFELIAQSPAGAMAINSSSGLLSVADASLFDFETNPTITGSVTVSSGDLSESVDVTVNLNDVAEGGQEIVINDFTGSVNKNPANGTVIGTVNASSTAGSLTFTLTTQSPDGAMALDASSGEITVADGSLFEGGNTVTGTVEVSDGTNTAQASISISVIEFTIWTGSDLTFTKADNTDHTVESNQDRLTDNVWISRSTDGGPIHNYAPNASGNNNDGPGGTEWALGTTDDISNLTFTPLRDAVGGQRGDFKDIEGQALVLHLIEDDIYLNVMFTSWSESKLGGFSYTRATEN